MIHTRYRQFRDHSAIKLKKNLPLKKTLFLGLVFCAVIVLCFSSGSALNTEWQQGGNNPGKQPPHSGPKQYTFQNNIIVNINSSANVTLDINIDETLMDRFFGLSLSNLQPVNISLEIRQDFPNRPSGKMEKYQRGGSTVNFVAEKTVPRSATTTFNPLQRILRRSSTDEWNSEYTYETFFILNFLGEFDWIQVYSQISSEWGLTTTEDSQLTWGIFNNITNTWQILDSEQSEDLLISTLSNDEIDNQQLILTIVSISPIEPTSIWTTPWGIAIIVGGILLLIVGIVLTQENYREFLLNRIEFINKGPHRLNIKQVLENENRTAIIDLILDHPGIHFNELLRSVKISAGTLAWHLDILETFQIIRKESIGQYLTYYPYYHRNPLSKMDTHLQKSQTTLSILQLIRNNPGLYQNQIAKLMQLNHKTIQYHLKKLLDAEVIFTETKDQLQVFFAKTEPSPPMEPDY